MLRKLSVLLFYGIIWCVEVAAQSVLVVKRAGVYEITNGLVGICIPNERADLSKPPAPIQSLIYLDGSKSDTALNILQSAVKPINFGIKFLQKTKSKVVVEIRYEFNKPEFGHYEQRYPGGEAGKGYYSCTVTLEKDKKDVIIEEDSDYDVSYSFSIFNGLKPDQARYRGWLSTSTEYGYETPGKVYRPENERGYPMDATLNLKYSVPTQYPYLTLWEPAGGERNTGRYWQVYNSKAASASNLLAIFQGRPSRLIGAKGIGVRLETVKNGDARIKMTIQRRGADNSWFSHKRFEWGIFISNKADLLEPQKIQPVAKAMNRLSGIPQKVSSPNYKPHIIPAFYNASIYLPSKEINEIIQKIKKEEQVYKQLCSVDPTYKIVWDAWRFKDSAISKKRMVLEFSHSLKESYINGEGAYEAQFRYWAGSNRFKTYAILISALFADPDISFTKTEKSDLEDLIGLMADLVWDENNVPMFDSSGVNMGPANMPVMYNNNGRLFFALLLSEDPKYKKRVQQIKQSVNNEVNNVIYENGSSFGTPHYIQPALEPVLYSVIQLKQATGYNIFKENDRLKKFANFYKALLTPPSVRFENNRKLISFGDGSEESSSLFALLATGLKGIDDTLSSELMNAYFNGPAMSSAFGPIGLTAKLFDKPEIPLNITSANYSGYLSHFRYGLNTEKETALWLLNGEKLYDHRNDDAGEFAFYALKAPLSVSSSSFYNPEATDSKIRTVVIPEQQFPEWDKKDQPIAVRSLTNRTWAKSQLISFANLRYSNSATVRMQNADSISWFRKINLIHVLEESPILVIYDSVTNNKSNIWSMMMMSDGAISTPLGNIVPIRKIYDYVSLKKELPEGIPFQKLSSGLNKFSFTGQLWSLHPSGGINWDMYLLNQGKSNFSLAQWGTTWQRSIEQNEFRISNGQRYVEEQQIIRVESNYPFLTFVLPYKKGGKKSAVEQIDDSSIAINYEDSKTIVSKDFFISKKHNTLIATLLSDKSIEFEGFSLDGGYTELEYTGDRIKIQIQGAPGTRKIRVPFELDIHDTTIKFELQFGTTVVYLPYTNSDIDLLNGEKGYIEFTFRRK
ncbi:MAG: hypothetical protein KF746_22005 [Chitinophagaceae bacterium]|nr:hypothetical protein [Chitinophagaceae bacterium]